MTVGITNGMPNDFKSPHQPPVTDDRVWQSLSFSRAATPCGSLEGVAVTEAARLMIDALGSSLPIVIGQHVGRGVGSISVIELSCAVKVSCVTDGGLTTVSLLDEPLPEVC